MPLVQTQAIQQDLSHLYSCPRQSSLLRTLRKYQTTHSAASPVCAQSRLAANQAIVKADAALAQNVVESALQDNEKRRLFKLEEEERKRAQEILCPHQSLRLDTIQQATKPHDDKSSSKEKDNMATYFDGTVGRLRLFHAYRDAKMLNEKSTDAIIALDDEPLSIAREFSRQALLRGARPSTALLKSINGNLNLKGLGLKDGIITALASVLPKLKNIRHINISDNCIGDDALASICDAVHYSCPSLEVFDLSHNKIGTKAALALQALLASGHKLAVLRMENADIDDCECAQLTAALSGNTSLTELHLSRNMIGKAEEHNVANQSFLTGPESIANSLASGEIVLTLLDLSWNYIRKDSAIALALALRNLPSLTELCLAHNCFADEATQHLAAALHHNTVLQILDLSFNAVPEKATLVLATMLKVNTTLASLKLDSNPIGRSGAAALMSAMQARGACADKDRESLKISMRQCGTCQSDNSLFNAHQPGGKYRLVLSKPYDRMIAIELLAIATIRNNSKFKVLRYFSRASMPPNRNSKNDKHSSTLQGGRDIKLHRAARNGVAKKRHSLLMPAKERGSSADWSMILARSIIQRRLAHQDLEAILDWMGLQLHGNVCDAVLTKIATSLNILFGEGQKQKNNDQDNETESFDRALLLKHIWRAIFAVADVDASECLSRTEFHAMLRLLGVQPRMNALDRVIAEYDSDNSGVIEADEFVALASALFATEIPVAKTALCESGNTPWIVPESGILDIEFESQPGVRSRDELGTEEGIAAFIDMLKTSKSDQECMLIFDVGTTATEVMLTGEQGRQIFDAAKCGLSAVDKLQRILPLVSTPCECTALIEDLSPSAEQKLELMRSLGLLQFDLIIGNPTGHYKLDLRKANDRIAARRLAGLANMERFANQESGHDTSQHGNHLNFRNERFQGKPIVLVPNWFTDIDSKAKQGFLEFDYVLTQRPLSSVGPMSARRFRALLARLDIESIDGEYTINSSRNSPLEGERYKEELKQNDPYAGISIPRKKEADPYVMQWRNWLSSSYRYITASQYSEKYELQRRGVVVAAADVIAPAQSQDASQKIPVKMLSRSDIRSSFRNSKGQNDLGSMGKGRNGITGPSKRKLSFTDVLSAAAESSAEIDDSDLPIPSAPSALYREFARRILLLKVSIRNHYISTAQLKIILQLFPRNEQYLRVELIMSVFSRIADLVKLDTLIDTLNDDEQKEIFHRLGYLNTLNSINVDRAYKMRLKVPDERKMASILVQYAIQEPGVNWVDEKFKRKESMPFLSGWQLPIEWAEKIVSYGILQLTYSSTGRGCKPDHAFRRTLYSHFLCGRRCVLKNGHMDARDEIAVPPSAQENDTAGHLTEASLPLLHSSSTTRSSDTKQP